MFYRLLGIPFLLLAAASVAAAEFSLADTSDGNMDIQKYFTAAQGTKAGLLPENLDIAIKNIAGSRWAQTSGFQVAAVESFLPADREKFNCDVFALVPVILAVSSDNPLEDISVEDLKRIYSGKIGSWQRLGGKNIKLYYAGSSGEKSVFRAFKALVMEQDLFAAEKSIQNEIAPGFIDCGDVAGAAALLKIQPGIIVFGSHQLATDDTKSYKILKINGVYPAREHIVSGRYPLVAAHCLLSRKNVEIPHKNEVLAFLRNCAAENPAVLKISAK